ncbi:777_t:CDS:2 [Ambispora leptoticha]|uniref:777_t:CDS:1 n=1 Tax=Ambispora leptoticha TaxID=144679 RepID=A0A9N8YW42_9GLOM|nr:777_t:CDS:2 [Ambispora leptoticha]
MIQFAIYPDIEDMKKIKQIQKMQFEIDTLKVQIDEITGNDEDYIPDDTN